MKEFLVQNKVPDVDIVVDNKGDNTLATVGNTLKLIDPLHFKSVIVVLYFFHFTRTKKLFKNRNLAEVSSANAFYFEY